MFPCYKESSFVQITAHPFGCRENVSTPLLEDQMSGWRSQRGFFGGGTRLKLQFLIRSISANQRPPLPTSSSSSSGSVAVPCVLPPSVSGAGTRLPESGERREEPQRSPGGAVEEPGCCLGNQRTPSGSGPRSLTPTPLPQPPTNPPPLPNSHPSRPTSTPSLPRRLFSAATLKCGK